MNNTLIIKDEGFNSRFQLLHAVQTVRIKSEGFTLIELILYVAIISIIVGALVPFAWNILGNSAKSTTQQEVYSQARLLSEKLKKEIRNARGINSDSTFNQNLATTPTTKLSLVGEAPNDPIIIDVASQLVRITYGTGQPTPLHSNTTKVTDLTFTNYSTADNKTTNISFSFRLESASPSLRQEFSDFTVMQSSVELRSRQ